MFIAIAAVIGVKVITGHRLNRQRKALASINERLRDVRVELEHAGERKKAAGNETSFLERRRVELDRLIPEALRELEDRSSSANDETKDQTAEPHVPRHMQPRSGTFLRTSEAAI